ncbi:hypothetical protein PJM25_29235, partial [Mycobacterium kansasii]
MGETNVGSSWVLVVEPFSGVLATASGDTNIATAATVVGADNGGVDRTGVGEGKSGDAGGGLGGGRVIGAAG